MSGDLLVLISVLFLQNPLQVRDVGGGQPEGVQLGQLRVWRNPGEGQLESAESFAQDPHPVEDRSAVGDLSLKL